MSSHIIILGGRRFSEGTSADREIQRTLMEVILGKGDLKRSLYILIENMGI